MGRVGLLPRCVLLQDVAAMTLVWIILALCAVELGIFAWAQWRER